MAEQQIGRLAMRAEGDWWVAYYAKMGTMADALELGRIRLSCVQEDAQRNAAMECFKSIVGAMIAGVVGADVAWPTAPQAAPEHEKSGEGIMEGAFTQAFRPTIWHRLGFGHCHVAPWGDKGEAERGEDGLLVTSLVTETHVHFGFIDRLRILITGNVHVFVRTRSENDPGRAESRSAVSVKPPEPRARQGRP